MSELVSGIYQGAVPIRFEDHRNLRFSNREDYRFAARLAEVPIVHTEWVTAARHYPVVFSGPKPSAPERAVALVKMAPEDTHPFLRADNGHWAPEHYIPQYLRSYPFTIQMTDPTTPVLMAVIEAPHFSDRVGEPLFTKTGEMSPFLTERLDELKTYLEKISQTRSVVELFKNLELLSLGRVFSNDTPDHERLTQVVSVAPEKLSKLPAETLAQLNQQGILPLAYAQIQSLENIGRLYRASQASVDRPETVPAVESDPTRLAEPSLLKGEKRRHYYLGVSLALGMAAAFLLGSWLGPEWESDSSAENQASSQPGLTPPGSEQVVEIEPVAPAMPEREPAAIETTADTESEAVGELEPPVQIEEEAPAAATREHIAPVTPPADDAGDNESDASTEAVDAEPEVAGAHTPPSLAISGEETQTAAEEAGTPTPPVTRPEESLPEVSNTSEAQTAPGDQKEDTKPSLTPEVRNEIDRLLRAIQRDIRRNHLSLPVHDNAVDKINRIYALDPGNRSARSALYDVVDRYIFLARKARGRQGKAYLQSAHRIAPDLLEIDQAWEELYAPEPPVWYTTEPQD